MCARARACVRACMCVCVCACACVYVGVCVSACTCTWRVRALCVISVLFVEYLSCVVIGYTLSSQSGCNIVNK